MQIEAECIVMYSIKHVSKNKLQLQEMKKKAFDNK